MKTLEALYKEVTSSKELKNEFAEAANGKETLAAWLKKYDCGATVEELGTFLKEKSDGEMEDDDVETVAGGKIDGHAVVLSFATLGWACMERFNDSVSVNDIPWCFDEERNY